MKQQKHKLIKRVLSVVLSLSMALCLIPSTVFAAEGDVAQIGEKTYATLDEAVEQAPEGATIELLQDCELTKGFNKTLTFTGNGKITINKQLTSNGEGWMCFGLYDSSRVLTFDGAGVEVEWSSEVGTAPWLMLSLSGTLNVTNGAKVSFTVDSGSTGSRNAIYMNAGSKINVSNGSTFEIFGNETAGKEGQGIQLDQTGTANINVTGNSTFLIDGTNRGYVNSPTIYVENSNFTVQNCTANASNGGSFTAINSKVNYSNNVGHGLSASSITLKNSSLTADNNGYYGVYTTGGFSVDSTSVLTVTHNSYGGDCAGLKLTSGVTNGKVEAGAVVTITDNYCSGLSNNGKCVFEEDSKLTITNNNNDKGTTSNGGGIYNSGASANLTLPSDAVIYNNHADTAGDDVYNTGTVVLGSVGEKWALDDCDHIIDGWYQDGANARWDADGAKEHVTLVNPNTFTSLTALKAAHGIDAQDKTSYPGMDKTVETTDSEGNKIWSDNETVAAGDTVNFKLESNVPDDLMNYIIPDVENPEVVENEVSTLANVPIEDRGEYSMTIHDQMDKAFVDMTAPVVTLDRAGDDNDVTLENTYYYTTATDDGCTFHIVIDLIALYENGIITDEDIASATPITVTYTATLSASAVAGSYENTAWVTYPTGESEKPVVTVDTYGITIFKYDSANPETGLSGAVFEIYQKDESGTVITDSKVELTSGDDGYATLDGLDSGTYYIKETKAPEGYVCSDQELTVTIPDQAGTDNIVTVNFANTQIPHTGGMGTTLYTVGGGLIVAAAAVLFVVSRKKRQSK